MKTLFLISPVLLALALTACDKPTVVAVPVPVAVPGPAGPAGISGTPGNAGATGATGATGAVGSTGSTGMDGNKGEPGKAGNGTTVIVLPPAASAPTN